MYSTHVYLTVTLRAQLRTQIHRKIYRIYRMLYVSLATYLNQSKWTAP